MWVEVLGRHGEVASRTRVDGGEARIGRAFDNDVVLDDPHVAPHHLRVARDEAGVLVAEDLGTVNGLFGEHGERRLQRIALSEAPGLRIGRTILRIYDAARPVAPEKPLAAPRSDAAWAALLGAALATSLLALQWLGLTQETSAGLFLLPLLVFAAILAAWTAAWSLLSRVFFGQARFALQLRIALTAGLALLAIDVLARAGSFSLAFRALDEYDGYAVWPVFAAACFAHLRSIATRHMNFAMGLVVALGVAGGALQYVGMSEARKLLGERATLGDLWPPAWRLVPAVSLDAFLEGAEATRRRVDRARLEDPFPTSPESR